VIRHLAGDLLALHVAWGVMAWELMAWDGGRDMSWLAVPCLHMSWHLPLRLDSRWRRRDLDRSSSSWSPGNLDRGWRRGRHGRYRARHVHATLSRREKRRARCRSRRLLGKRSLVWVQMLPEARPALVGTVGLDVYRPLASAEAGRDVVVHRAFPVLRLLPQSVEGITARHIGRGRGRRAVCVVVDASGEGLGVDGLVSANRAASAVVDDARGQTAVVRRGSTGGGPPDSGVGASLRSRLDDGRSGAVGVGLNVLAWIWASGLASPWLRDVLLWQRDVMLRRRSVVSTGGLGQRLRVRLVHAREMGIPLSVACLRDGTGVDAGPRGQFEVRRDADSLSDNPLWGLLRLGVRLGGDSRHAKQAAVLLAAPFLPPLPLPFPFPLFPFLLLGALLPGLLLEPVFQLDERGLEPLIVELLL
jgi:hypothetical protein